MATYAQFKHVELYKIGHGKNRVPNAPKSCIAEIFNSDTTDGGSPVKSSSSRPRVVRDSPTRPRDTHSRLFGQPTKSAPLAPLVTDTIRSHIQFGEAHTNGTNGTHSPKMNGNHTPKMNGSPAHSPTKMNGSASSTPSRGETEGAEQLSYQPPKRNPVTGDGVFVPGPRRRHPAACLRGAQSNPDQEYFTHDQDHFTPKQVHYSPDQDNFTTEQEHPLLNPQPQHRYFTRDWPPKPAQYYVESTTKPALNIKHTPYTLLGLKTDDPEKVHPVIDPDSLSPQPVLDRHWPPFPAQHYLEPKEHKLPLHPLPPYSSIGLTSAFGERPKPDYKYDPVPSLDGNIDPFLVANNYPPPSLFKYERDGPIPDFTPLQTEVTPGPHTLTGFPPIFHKHVPGYLFDRNRHAGDFRPRTYFVDYVRQREMEGNPITGDGYRSINGQINTVTSVNANGQSFILHNRVPPGGYSSGLW